MYHIWAKQYLPLTPWWQALSDEIMDMSASGRFVTFFLVTVDTKHMFYLMTLKKKKEKKMEKKYVIIWCSFKYVQCMEYTFGENHIIFNRGFFFKKKPTSTITSITTLQRHCIEVNVRWKWCQIRHRYVIKCGRDETIPCIILDY